MLSLWVDRQVSQKEEGEQDEMTTLTCQGCGAETVLSNHNATISNMGTLIKDSGYEPTIRIDCTTGWWCPSCTSKAIPHIEALLDLLGDHHRGPRIQTHWNSLVGVLNRWNLANKEK